MLGNPLRTICNDLIVLVIASLKKFNCKTAAQCKILMIIIIIQNQLQGDVVNKVFFIEQTNSVAGKKKLKIGGIEVKFMRK